MKSELNNKNILLVEKNNEISDYRININKL